MQVGVLDSFRASNNFERGGGNKKPWHTPTFVNPHFHGAYLTPSTWPWKVWRQCAVLRDTKMQRLDETPKKPKRSGQIPWTQTHTFGNQLAAWCVVMPFDTLAIPMLSEAALHTDRHAVGSHSRTGVSVEPEVQEAGWHSLALGDVCCLSPLKRTLQACVSAISSITFPVPCTQ